MAIFKTTVSGSLCIFTVDIVIIETCTDPCGPNRSDEAASTAADDDYFTVEGT